MTLYSKIFLVLIIVMAICAFGYNLSQFHQVSPEEMNRLSPDFTMSFEEFKEKRDALISLDMPGNGDLVHILTQFQEVRRSNFIGTLVGCPDEVVFGNGKNKSWLITKFDSINRSNILPGDSITIKAFWYGRNGTLKNAIIVPYE